MELIKYFNHKFSFASFNANFVDQVKRGIYNLKIQGQLCDTIFNKLDSQNDNSTIRGKMYLYDQEMIHFLIQDNPKLIEKHILTISTLLRAINPYVFKYKQLYKFCDNIPEYKLYFLRTVNRNPKTYNKP